MFYSFQGTSFAHIPEYFLIFDATVNAIVFLNLFLDYLFLEYRKKIELCILLFYPSTMLNLLFLKGFFVCGFLRIFYIQGYDVCKWRQFYLFLSNLYAFCVYNYSLYLIHIVSILFYIQYLIKTLKKSGKTNVHLTSRVFHQQDQKDQRQTFCWIIQWRYVYSKREN